MKNRLIVVSITALSVLATGCNDTAEVQKGQTVVRVNGDEITTHQISYGLAQRGEIANETKMREVAEQYVDQQLLLQKAMEQGLQRNATVMRALDEARRQVLAQAYLEQTLGNVAPPTAAAIGEYYRKHPELFSRRMHYDMQQLTLAKSVPLSELENRIRSSSSMKDVAAWANANDVLIGRETVSLPAEKIDLDMLPKIYRMKPGQRIVFDKPEHRLVIALLGTELHPMGEAQASPFIEQYLLSEQRDERGHQELKRLRALARIEWLDDFSGKQAAAMENGTTASAGDANVNHRVE